MNSDDKPSREPDTAAPADERRGTRGRDGRKEREAAALRANLARRKRQQRERDGARRPDGDKDGAKD